MTDLFRISQALINNEIEEITHKIDALDAMRAKLEEDLLKLQEDELELDDECECLSLISEDSSLSRGWPVVEGVKERLELETSSSRPGKSPHPGHMAHSSRRRKGL